MRTKLCVTCGPSAGPKPIEEFHYKNKAKGTRQDKCIPCANAYAAKQYEQNKEKRLEQINDRQNKTRAANRETYATFLKNGACAVCGESDTRCLTSSVSNDDVLYRSSPVLNEMLKTAVVKCLNCTAKATVAAVE